jgi:hypothetical protein
MSYSCSDFTDNILAALGIVVPLEDKDNPEAQAILALAKIYGLQRTGKQMGKVLRDLVAILDAIPEADRLRLGLYSILAINEVLSLAQEVEGTHLSKR